MTKAEIEIRESEEEIRKLRRDKKGNWKQFVKYYEGYIHGLKAHQSQLKPQDNFHQKILKQTPIKTRLNTLFQMEWLVMNSSKKLTVKAIKWADELSEQVIKDFKTWEENGKPQEGNIKICDCSGSETGTHNEFCHRNRGEFPL